MMGRRMWGMAIVTLLLVTLTVPQVSAQAEVVDLKLKLQLGEVFYYQIAKTMEQSTEIGSNRQVSDIKVEAREAHRVLQADADGTVLVELVYEDFKVTSEARTEEKIDTPLMMKLRQDGSVAEVLSGDEQPTTYPFRLPNRPVAVGESWSEPVGDTGITRTFSLVRMDQVGADRIAIIRGRAERTVNTVPGTSALPAGVTVRFARTTVRNNQEIHWSVERGRVVRGTDDFSILSEFELASNDNTVRVRQSFKGSERREPLAAVSIAAAIPGPDLLIVPGIGIGATTLDLPVADLTNRHGTPESREASEPYRIQQLKWPNDLFGYVDAADANRLVGIQISDKRHRTDRGLGFGSSEGAILVAYGLKPIRLDVTMSGLGAIRFLIYNDLGITFAINRDKAHAAMGPAHAPVGAVDWVLVFKPGEAEKIFSLPSAASTN